LSLKDNIRAARDTERMADTFGYNEGVRGAWTPIWTRNAGRSYKEVERRFSRQDCDLRNIPKINGEPVLILGSGPSLDDALPYLKDWKGKIACSTSQLPLLKYMDIEPDYVVLIDADPSMAFLVSEFVKGNQKSFLVCHPQIPREIIEAWPEDRVFFFRMFDPGDEFSTKYLPLMYGWLNQEKGWSIGSYILNSGNVVNALLPMCQAIGAGKIFLLGYDLGYPDLPDKPGVPRHRSSFFGNPTYGYHTGEPDTLHEAPEMPSYEQRPIEYKKSNNGVLADELCWFYKYSFMILYGLSGIPVISCSRGILSELQYVHPKEVIEKQGVGFDHLIRPAPEAYLIARDYLHFRGLYIQKTDYWIATVNIQTKKGLAKLWFLITWYWYGSRPWKWMGGSGWKPMKVKWAEYKAKHAKKPPAPPNVMPQAPTTTASI
jgi:hypothetical protein